MIALKNILHLHDHCAQVEEVVMKVLPSASLGMCMLALGCYLERYEFEKPIFFQIISRVLQNLLTDTSLEHAKQN